MGGTRRWLRKEGQDDVCQSARVPSEERLATVRTSVLSRCSRMCLTPRYMSQTPPTQPAWALLTGLSMVGRWVGEDASRRGWGTGQAEEGGKGRLEDTQSLGTLESCGLQLPFSPSQQARTNLNFLFLYSLCNLGKERQGPNWVRPGQSRAQHRDIGKDTGHAEGTWSWVWTAVGRRHG